MPLLNSFLDATVQLGAELARTGRLNFSKPRVSDWVINGWGQSTVGVDVADLALGAGYVIPANINVSAGTVDLALYKPSANLAFKISGTGGSLGVAAGWSALPALTGRSKTLSKSKLGKKAVDTVAGNAAKKGTGFLDSLAGMPASSVGTLMAGPKAPSVLAPIDFEGCLTLVGGEVNFAANGLYLGAAFFAKKPVLDVPDFAFVRAFGLLWDVHLTLGNVDAGVNYANFVCKVDKKSLPFPGAMHGASVPK